MDNYIDLCGDILVESSISIWCNMSTISGLLDVLQKYAHGNLPLQSKITSEMKLFSNAEHDFGRVSTINNRTLMPPGI
jgi:hypothetical protein